MTNFADDKQPTRDIAEDNAFFPSPFSLSQFTSKKSDLRGADYPNSYRGGRWKILVVAADERYLLMKNGSFFSTGNHPVETLLPMYHLDKAGFGFDIATLSGNPVKFEYWAMPSEDTAVMGLFDKYVSQFKAPLKLADVIANALGEDSDYIGVFIPGGHGALIGLPFSAQMAEVLRFAHKQQKFIISLCHGPAALLAVGKDALFAGYQICAFPDALDAQTPEIGYMPGHLTWQYAQQLQENGFTILNEGISGQVHRDRNLLTGDSPLAANALGQLAAETLLASVTE
jgi:molecular chaperone Hsp31 and glyoxalase 3